MGKTDLIELVEVPRGGVWRFYPAGSIGTLDPSDDRRLPDGSRWVDAAALAAVLRGGA